MEHLFIRHTKRNNVSLNGEWKFCCDKENVGINEKWYESFPQSFSYATVPSCWNTDIKLFDYFGVAWYSREITTEKGNLLLQFAGVSGEAAVYLDGERLGDHYGGWTAFGFNKNVEEGVHTVTVRVDSTTNDHNTIPMTSVDWYHYGGITRGVYATLLKTPYIIKHRISYELNEALTEAEVAVNFELYNPFQEEYSTDVKIYIEGFGLVAEEKAVSGKVELKGIALQDISLWDTESPRLYTVKIETEDDDLFEQIGFRKIEVNKTEILLNKKPLYFRGVNRHEEHPDWGFAVPLNLMKRDFEIVKDLNCNIIRGSHYPNSQGFLDCLDREGMLFWSEIPMWGCTQKLLADPLTLERGIKMHSEMIDQYYHHPSIIIWGLHNEIRSDTKEGYELTKSFYNHVRACDNTRLVTYATDKFDKDICLEFTDFVSLNYYMGWYTGSFDDWDGFIKGIRAKLTEKGMPEKPAVMSEFGCAAIYGYSNFSEDKWTMQYQAEMLDKIIKLCEQENGMVGTFVWQFADIRSAININRARSFNNKGILDEYRRPKMSYYTVKKLYGEIKNKNIR